MIPQSPSNIRLTSFETRPGQLPSTLKALDVILDGKYKNSFAEFWKGFVSLLENLLPLFIELWSKESTFDFTKLKFPTSILTISLTRFDVIYRQWTNCTFIFDQFPTSLLSFQIKCKTSETPKFPTNTIDFKNVKTKTLNELKSLIIFHPERNLDWIYPIPNLEQHQRKRIKIRS
ncbi:unnamed protein product [Ambrosiozyma monospora]|uniref:Unnamed protein product n=1 Tax=Ambrosiozyma monospora TaxID=43982 RepID=A0ACB5T6E4_AMBMO|nr:unnamed protein product [Ambrosiozyma monospora]